jgi:hypothetical protein
LKHETSTAEQVYQQDSNRVVTGNGEVNDHPGDLGEKNFLGAC